MKQCYSVIQDTFQTMTEDSYINIIYAFCVIGSILCSKQSKLKVQRVAKITNTYWIQNTESVNVTGTILVHSVDDLKQTAVISK